MPNFNNTTTTDFGNVTDFNYSIDEKNTDGGYGNKENEWINSNASKYYGHYYNVGEYRSAINAFATRVIGQGYDVSLAKHKADLDAITGWGEDTFQSIMWNMIVTKKFNGDSYAEIIRNKEGTLINLKTLDPKRIKHITNQKGMLIRYEYTQGDGKTQKYKPEKMLHFCNDRILDEPHGTAVTSAVEWVCEAIEEAKRDWRKIMHKSTLLIFYVDENDTARQTKLKTEMGEGIKNGDILLLTCKPEDARFEPIQTPPAQAWQLYLNSLEDKFYKQLGFSKSVIGGTAENTEAAAKMDMANAEPIWVREMVEIEKDIWNQLAIKIKIGRQPSIMNNVQADEAANTGQTKLEFQGSQ